MSIRKPVVIADDSDDSQTTLKLFNKKGTEHIQYHINKLASSRCGGTSDETNIVTTTAPVVIAPEGIFKGLAGIKNYFDSERR